MPIGAIAVPESVFARFRHALASEVGSAHVDRIPEDLLAALERATFGNGVTKQLREQWLACFPQGSIDWPARYLEYVAAASTGRRRLTVHELALQALIGKVKGRCYKAAYAEKDDVPSLNFVIFSVQETSRARCRELGSSCLRTEAFDWNGYISCPAVNCTCHAFRADQRGVDRVLEIGHADRTQIIELVQL